MRWSTCVPCSSPSVRCETAQLQRLRARRRQAEALLKKNGAFHLATERALTAEMSQLRVYVREKMTPSSPTSWPASSINRSHTTAPDGDNECLIEAFADLSTKESEGEREENTLACEAPGIARTAILVVRLEVERGAGRWSRPSSPVSTETVYGRGLPYRSAGEVCDEAPVAEGRVAIAA